MDVDGGEGEGEPHPVLRQPKRAAVLFFVLLDGDGGMVRRDRLVDVFWPGTEDGRGRSALRQTLTYLRDRLPPGALTRRGNSAVGVDRRRVGVDVHRFEALLGHGRAAEALELYRGDLLEGFVVDAGPAFDAWLEDRREALRSRAAGEAWALASAAEEEERGAEAAFWAKRALALSPFDEAGVQRLLGLLARVGDVDGVERAFRGLEARLAGEGRRPDALTVRIVEEARAGQGGGPAAGADGGPESGPTAGDGAGGGRRSGWERRAGEERRVETRARPGAERRRGGDRREGSERRSGRDRRAQG